MHFLVMLLLCDRALAVHFNPTAPNRRVESYHSSEKKNLYQPFSAMLLLLFTIVNAI